MKRNFLVGDQEKHRLLFHVNWFLGYCHLSVDGKTLFRRPFFLKVDKSFEIGTAERHLVSIEFNVFDYFRNVLKVVVDGQDITNSIEGREKEYRFETPVDDAAAALLYVAAMNLLFAVIGTLFVPYLDSVHVRLMLLVGGLIYVLMGIKILSGSRSALIFAILFFTADSAVNLFFEFSAGGMLIRIVILYYLLIGFKYMRRYPALS